MLRLEGFSGVAPGAAVVTLTLVPKAKATPEEQQQPAIGDKNNTQPDLGKNVSIAVLRRD